MSFQNEYEKSVSTILNEAVKLARAKNFPQTEIIANLVENHRLLVRYTLCELDSNILQSSYATNETYASLHIVQLVYRRHNQFIRYLRASSYSLLWPMFRQNSPDALRHLAEDAAAIVVKGVLPDLDDFVVLWEKAIEQMQNFIILHELFVNNSRATF